MLSIFGLVVTQAGQLLYEQSPTSNAPSVSAVIVEPRTDTAVLEHVLLNFARVLPATVELDWYHSKGFDVCTASTALCKLARSLAASWRLPRLLS